MSSMEKSNVSNLEGKTKPENVIIKHPELEYEYNILKEYKNIYDRLTPYYKLRLLGYNEDYRNEVLGKIKKEYEETGKSKYILDSNNLEGDANQLEEVIAPKDIQNELFNPQQEIDAEENHKLSPPEQFNRLVKIFYDRGLFRTPSVLLNNELEIRFGTKDIKRLTKNDYDNVVKTLKSFGFVSANPSGVPSLRIKNEFLDSTTGRFKMSDIRTQIDGLIGIEKYCKSNDIRSVYKSVGSSVEFLNKKPFLNPDDKKMIRPVDINDFNFRVSLQSEERVKKGIENHIIENWRKSKKEFRYLNRVTFERPDLPVRVDLSITKSGNKGKDKRGFNYIIPVYTIEESNVFNNQESYEIEIEVNNKLIDQVLNIKHQINY